MRRRILLLGLILLATGCSRSNQPAPVPVAGRVTWKGQPLPYGRVAFEPADRTTGRVAIGDVDSSGRYRLSTFVENDGAFPGSYRVAVIGHDATGAKTAKVFEDFPDKLANGGESGLTATVKNQRSQQQIDFALQP